jgi:hypothetical protein
MSFRLPRIQVNVLVFTFGVAKSVTIRSVKVCSASNFVGCPISAIVAGVDAERLPGCNRRVSPLWGAFIFLIDWEEATFKVASSFCDVNLLTIEDIQSSSWPSKQSTRLN